MLISLYKTQLRLIALKIVQMNKEMLITFQNFYCFII
jgi:hypothetical protein